MPDRHANHQHGPGVEIGSGTLAFGTSFVNFVWGLVFLEWSTPIQQQRVCLRLIEPVAKTLVQKAPFADLILDEPVMINSYPLKWWQVFLKSGRLNEQNLDVLISPEVKKLDTSLRPKL